MLLAIFAVFASNRFLAFPLSKSRILPNLEILPFLRYFLLGVFR